MPDDTDPCACNAILIQNIDAFASTTATQLAILRAITEESFEELKKGIATGGSIIYQGIPISGNGSWDDFQQRRQTRFEDLHYDSSMSIAVGELHQYLSKEVVAAWASCKENCAKKTSGFVSWIERFDAETVTVRFYLNSPPGVPTPAKINTSQLVGGRAYEKNVEDGAAFPASFEFQDEVPVRRTYFREPNSAFTVTVDLEFDATAAYLPPYSSEASVSGVPIGTVVAYCGRHDKLSKGWMLCNGEPLFISEAQELYNVIGTSHGSGIDPASLTKTKDFNLPDYRGLFLRGTDIDAGRDPDRADRKAAYKGGNSENAVGSVQPDAFQDHTHSVVLHGNNNLNGIGSFANPMGATSTGTANSGRSASETRPKNAYVNYIIRAR